ncbi:CocE/NonD family hydrolase [Micromonospora sp. WP24]|uniref:CocE/NonD family hydrolase n=1 Tax=Micromonospora sp. WP24 TaxID=2604469 RepID=UPI0011D53168|nr:CocE/NonD family hydrolase [Micromonospora sp. WP24]TYB98780.1 CocE/NonD family hydrolase [Micromonospora sp. WP24]
MQRRTTAAALGVLLTASVFTGGVAAAAPATAAEAPPEGITHEENDRVPEGSVWTEHYFPSTDGVELHADVLRPEGLPAGAKTPVILAVGPYFGHAGQTGPEGFTRTGPSARFNDFLEGADLFDEGFTYVMVDLRGFGGSTGCLDNKGPGEQNDVRAAIEWSASQPWSNGNVGMYGKSYDGATGLMGNNLKMPQLKAVVAQESIWTGYNYLFSNGVPRPNATGTPNSYNSIATMDPLADDTSRYQANARYEESHPECLSKNIADNYEPDPNAPFWQARDMAAKAKGTTTPLFITAGFIENNTKPEEMEEFLENHVGPERGWLGQWDHVRGNDRVSDGRLAMGREGWFDEVMSFYDQYLKGEKPTTTYPTYSIEDNLGEWRAEPTWPTPDRRITVALGNGTYVDDGGAAGVPYASSPSTLALPKNSGQWDMESAPRLEGLGATRKAASPSASSDAASAKPASSYLVWSDVVRQATRLTATPRVELTAGAAGNVMVKLWDVAPDGTAVMFDENVSLVEKGRVGFDLKSTDWTLQAGHRLAVEIGSITTGSWRDTPSGATIRVTGAVLRLTTESTADDVPTAGERSPFLDSYIRAYTRTFPEPGKPKFRL